MTERFDHPWLHQKELTLICSVGRLSKEKDYSTLIKAFCIYRAKHPEARLLIFGEGEERRTLEALIRDRGLTRDVFLPGYRKDLSCAFKRMDVFVCSSTREGLNNALIEALSYGTRIVSTKCGGPENVLAGLEAELVAIGDAVALEQGISEALTSKKIDDSRVRRAKSYHVDQVYPEFRRLLMAA
jgi:glycosyltransferase involved in cell wall biosynthesis